MAKKTSKTTNKKTSKPTKVTSNKSKATKDVAKTTAKKSKKGLIIGISIGAAVAVAAGVTIPLVLMNMNKGGGGGSDDVKFSVDKTTIVLDDSLKDTLNLDWKPSDHYIECSDFTFTLKNQTDITANVVEGEVGSRPLSLTITFSKELEKEYKGELKFKYNDKTTGKKGGVGQIKDITVKMQDTPEPEKKATFSIDSDTYGTLTYEEQENLTSVDISNAIDGNSVRIMFVPGEGYEDRDFKITLTGTEAKDFDLKFKGNEIAIEGKSGRTFRDGDNLTATVTLVEEASFSLASGSETYGHLTDDDEDTIDIAEYIDKSSFTVSFYPEEGYEDRDFDITIDDGKKFTAEYTKPATTGQPGIITLTGVDEYKLADQDELEATFDLVEEVGNCFGLQNVSTNSKDVHITLTPSDTVDVNPEVYYTLQNPADTNGWTKWDYTSGDTILLNAGKVVYFKGNNASGFSTKDCHYTFGMQEEYDEDIKIVGHGNIMSLIDNGACTTEAIPDDYCFSYLFQYFKRMELDNDFVLSATTLTSGCYYHMFDMDLYPTTTQPSILTHAPDLPATHLYPRCYGYMFSYASIVNPPIISATTLVSVGADPSTQSEGYQCSHMFERCSLTSTPDLSKITSYSTPGFTIAADAFADMFNGCTSLTEVPKNSFPTFSEKVQYGTFNAMFQSCLNVTKVDFSNVTVVNEDMCVFMFSGCSKLNDLTVGFGTPDEDTWPLDESCSWLSNVASTGTFRWKGTDDLSKITWDRDKNHVPSGWTIATIS